jgi:hypothetical protein
LEACDKYTAGLRVCPLRFTQDRAVLYANRWHVFLFLWYT